MGNRTSVSEPSLRSPTTSRTEPANPIQYEYYQQQQSTSWPSAASTSSHHLSSTSSAGRRSRRRFASVVQWQKTFDRNNTSRTSVDRPPSVRSQSTASNNNHEHITSRQSGVSSVHSSATPRPPSIVEFMSSAGPDVVLPPVNLKAAALWRPQNPNDDVRKYHPVQPATEALMSAVSTGNRPTLQHRLGRHLFGNKNFAGVPRVSLENGIRVLDVGCGNAVWLIEMESEFPNGFYHGVDIDASAWRGVRLGPNSRIKLQTADVLAGLPFHDDSFDYVHQQWLHGDIPEAAWPHVIAELTRVLKPGGYLDLVESDAMPLSLPTKRTKDMYTLIDALFRERGINLRVVYDIKGFVEENPRLTSVNAIRRTMPIGWDGDVGAIVRLHASHWLHSLRSAVSKCALLPDEDDDDGRGGGAVFVGKNSGAGVPGHVWDWLVEAALDDFTAAKGFVNTYRIWARKGVRGQFTGAPR